MTMRRIGWRNMKTGEYGYGEWLNESESYRLEEDVRKCNEQCTYHVHFIQIRDKPSLYKRLTK